MPSPPPDVEALRSADEATSAAAWAAAYPPLFEAGMRVACARLSGRRHAQDCEDLVAKALAQMVRGLVENEPPPTPGLRREGSRGDEKGNSCGTRRFLEVPLKRGGWF